MSDQFPLKTIRVDGAQLHYIEHGAGEPLVFIHGSLSDYRTWMDQIEPFGSRYHVVAYSRRYHYPNETTCASGQSPVFEQRDDLARLIRLLDMGPAYLVASSFGGVVAFLLAQEHPELVRALVLGGPPFLSLLSPADLQEVETRILGPSRQAVEQGEVEEGVRIFLEGMIADGIYHRMQPASRQRVQDNFPSFVLEQRTPFARHFSTISRGDLSRLRTPTLLITGAQDSPCLNQIAEILLAAIPNIEQADIPGLSHGSLHNQSVKNYNEAVMSYLRNRF